MKIIFEKKEKNWDNFLRKFCHSHHTFIWFLRKKKRCQKWCILTKDRVKILDPLITAGIAGPQAGRLFFTFSCDTFCNELLTSAPSFRANNIYTCSYIHKVHRRGPPEGIEIKNYPKQQGYDLKVVQLRTISLRD